MPYRHHRLTAWLGLIAIWFAIAVPLASQWRASEQADAGAIVCSAVHPASGDAHHALHLDQCGYCNLFAHLPAIGGTPPAAPRPAAVLAHTQAPPSVIAARAAPWPRAYPRAPPAQA